MELKWIQNRKESFLGPKLTTRWLPRTLYREGGVDFGHFWVPLAAPKSTKNRFFAKNGIPNANFYRFLYGKPFFVFCTRFFFDFSRKIDEHSTKKTVYFCHSIVVFFNMPTLTKPCILRYESNFFTF